MVSDVLTICPPPTPPPASSDRHFQCELLAAAVPGHTIHTSVLSSAPQPLLVSRPLLNQVKCYHKKFRSATRDVIFRLQFHTGAVQGYGLLFGKEELDSACKGEWMEPSVRSIVLLGLLPTRWQRYCQQKQN